MGWFWKFVNTRLGRWLYGLLPDKCALAGWGCSRKGVRGNEQRIGDKIICDDCSSEYRSRFPKNYFDNDET